MKRTMRVTLVLGLLAAGLTAHSVLAQEPDELFDGPGLVDAGDAEPAPLLADAGIGHGMDMGLGVHGPGMRRGRHHLGLGPRLAQELNLTAEQKEKMKASRERQQRKAIQTRADIQLARLDLHKLMEAEKPDQRAIDAQIDKVAALRTSLEKSRVATMIEFRSSLTPEQQKKLRELREQGPQRVRRANPQRPGGDM